MNPLNDILQCPICLDHFRTPKILPCQHTFCSPCLQKIPAERYGSIVCPSCRASHDLPWNGVDGLPSNLTMVQLLDVPLQNKCSITALCQVCRKNNIQGECRHCGDKILCSECLQNHTQILNNKFQEAIEKGENELREITNELAAGRQRREEAEKEAKVMKGQIEEWRRKCISEIESKTNRLLEGVKAVMTAETEIYKKSEENRDSYARYFEQAKTKSQRFSHVKGDNSSIQEQQEEIVRLTNECLKRISNGPGIVRDMQRRPNKYMKPWDSGGADSIRRSLSQFRGSHIVEKPYLLQIRNRLQQY